MANVTAASASSVRITASVVVMDMRSAVLTVVPVASIQRVTLVANALLDLRGLHFKLQDSISLDDLVSIQLDQVLADAIEFNEAFTSVRDYNRTFEDVQTFSDQYAHTVDFQRSFDDVIAITDSLHESFFKSLTADAFALADSGSVVSQGYADPSYFAQIYVGDSRTF